MQPHLLSKLIILCCQSWTLTLKGGHICPPQRWFLLKSLMLTMTMPPARAPHSQQRALEQDMLRVMLTCMLAFAGLPTHLRGWFCTFFRGSAVCMTYSTALSFS